MAEDLGLLRNFEADYDRAQGQIRQAASVWVLAGFAAFAFVLSAKSPPYGFTQPLFGVVVSWASAFGLVLLWIIDQLVYQKLLHSVFVHGLYLEWRDRTLQPIRTKMYYDNLNISLKLSLFYIVPAVAFLIVELYFAYQTISAQLCSPPDILVLLLLLAHFAAIVAMLVASAQDRNLVKQHGTPYPASFQSYLRDKSYRTELEKRLQS